MHVHSLRICRPEQLPIFEFAAKKGLEHHRRSRFGIKLDDEQRRGAQREHHKKEDDAEHEGQRDDIQQLLEMTAMDRNDEHIKRERGDSTADRGHRDVEPRVLHDTIYW